jgi:hypothetical protein
MDLTPKQALELWRAVSVAALGRKHPDLTARQFSLLLQVYLTPPPHTVRGLARDLAMSKPAVSRALDTLGRLDYGLNAHEMAVGPLVIRGSLGNRRGTDVIRGKMGYASK